MTRQEFDALRPGDVVKLADDVFWSESIRGAEVVVDMGEDGNLWLNFKEAGKGILSFYPPSKMSFAYRRKVEPLTLPG